MNNILELLAPAGDIKSLECAIYNGADAVYLGLSNFNARIKADNFTTDNIVKIVKFAHIYGVKVYLTINTLIKDNEVKDFLDMVESAIKAKVDAFIIQDFGMAKLLKENFPGIVLHASTQMGIHNLQGAKFIESLGFSRVVLARETKIEDIRLIKENTNLEIEYFVQGALCVAFSGNCYLSAIKNGNSGNRGKCLQLCRLPYKAYKKDQIIGEGYYLSPRDLCLMSRLKELQEAGVTSIKLEGRLKRPAYVAQTVRSYCRAVDSIIKKDTILDIAKEQKKMQEIFSRGQFNESAYLYDNFNKINTKINNHEGKNIGKVVNVANFKNIYKITLSLCQSIGEGDALRLVNDKKTISIGVGNVNEIGNGKYEIFSTQNPLNGSSVYLLKSNAKEENLINFVRKLPISMRFEGVAGKKAKLVANLFALEVEVESDNVLECAKSKAVVFEDVYKQVSKLNDTYFVLQDLSCDMDNVFVAVSVLNDLRRRVVQELENKIINMYNLTMHNVEICRKEAKIPILNTKKDNFVIIDDVNHLWNVNDYNIILAPREYSVKYLTDMVKSIEKKGYKKSSIYLDLPIVATTKELEKIESILSCLGVGIVINNYSQIAFAKSYDAIAGLGMNVYNMFTAEALLEQNLKNFVYSLEKDGYYNNAGIVYSKGCPTLMTLCHCPVQVVLGGNCGNCKYTDDIVLEDEKNNRYKYRRVKIDNCYFNLYSEQVYERKSNCGKIIDMRKV